MKIPKGGGGGGGFEHFGIYEGKGSKNIDATHGRVQAFSGIKIKSIG